MPATPRRFALRERTAAAHAALDAAVGGFATMEAYRRYLPAIYVYRAGAEAALAQAHWPAGLQGWRPQPIADLAREDLGDLAMAIPRTPAPASGVLAGDAVYGCCYVLAGSSLGARLLYSQARELGLHAGFGARHLAAQADAFDGWREFIRLMEAEADIDLDAAATAASSSFAAAEKAFRSLVPAS